MSSPIKRVREKRRDLLLILATAVLLSFAINLLTSYIAAPTDSKPTNLLLFSLAFLLGGILILKRIVFGQTEYIVRLRGAIAYKKDGETIEPIKVSGYSFNDDFCTYLRSFIQENKAYAKIFAKKGTDHEPTEIFNPDNLTRQTIINSVLEFAVLHQLDLHLNSYFVENEIDTSSIVALGRDQLGPGVLRNRVIDLITKDMKERPAFTTNSDDESEGVIVYSPGEDGAIYQRLDVELPPRSTISRNNDGFLVIANPLFEFKILPKYEGFSTTIPRVLAPSIDIQAPALLASINIHVRIKKLAFIMGGTMEMYEWLDSFIERMHEYVSTDRLEKRLNPDLIELLKS